MYIIYLYILIYIYIISLKNNISETLQWRKGLEERGNKGRNINQEAIPTMKKKRACDLIWK